MSRLLKISRKITGSNKLYNLAVDEDESYICNDIVVHNCRSILVPITKFRQKDMQRKIDSGKLKVGLRKPDSFYDGFKSKSKITQKKP